MLRTRIKSISVDESSVKFVGSVINCFMLYSCIGSFILLLLTLSMFMLKSPSTMISRISVLHAMSILLLMKVKYLTVRGSVKPSDEDCFGLCLNNPHSFQTSDFQVSSALAG